MKLNKITIARKETPSGKILLNFRCNQTSQYIKDFCGTIKFILILGLFFFFFYYYCFFEVGSCSVAGAGLKQLLG
jgi:hypothetical protein